jgi:hypothetical protein
MTHLLLVNYWGVLAATVAAFIFGNVYYIALGKHYAAAHGFTNEEMEAKYASPPIRQMIITFIATLIMSFMLYGILTHMRLSVQPVTPDEWHFILKLSGN